MSMSMSIDNAGAPQRPLLDHQKSLSVSFSGSKAALIQSEIDFMHGGSDDGVKSSNLQASITLFKVFVGSGILALPLTFVKVGFGLAIVGMVASACLAYYCMALALRVVNSLDDQKGLSLQSLTGRFMGKGGRISVEISLVIMQLGVAIAVLIFASQFLNHVLCDLNMEDYCNNLPFIGTFVAFIVIPLSFISNMHYFYYPSLLATFFIFINIITVFIYSIGNIRETWALDPNIIYDKMKEFNILELPKFFGVATFAFEGIGVLFSVRASMKTPKSFLNVLRVQMILITLLYTLFPGTAELAYREHTEEIILLNLPIGNKICLVIQSLYVVAQLFGFPVQLYPVFSIMENGLKKTLFDKEGRPKNLFLRFGLRILIILVLLFIALKVKSLNNFLNLLGSGVFVYLGYLLPIILYHLCFKKKASKFLTFVNFVVFPISTVLGIMGIKESIEAMIGE